MQNDVRKQRKIFMKVLLKVILALTLIGCNSAVDKKQTVSTVAQNSSPSPTASANLPVNQNSPSPPNPNYATSNICSAPKEIAANTPFAKLGGGKWEKWGASDGYLSYGCKDAKNLSNSIDIKTENPIMYVGVKYDALGEAQAVHNVATEYTAGQTPIIVPDEKKYREQYADFCDKLSSKFYGLKLPDTFKKKLLDESAYSPYETVIKYGEKVGTGYVIMTSEMSREKDLIRLKVYFYSNEIDYNKYYK